MSRGIWLCCLASLVRKQRQEILKELFLQSEMFLSARACDQDKSTLYLGFDMNGEKNGGVTPVKNR